MPATIPRDALGDREAGADDDPGRSWRHRLRDTDLDAFPRPARPVRHPQPPAGRNRFEDGLDVILDGIQARASRP
ncbi:hypothetical protein [Actinomadura sp. WMMB 499]|uniref:hypothetical protein n=1 Tax=Actinomadura sp. WMMB 499 TaxID=1219491 RepID=UPI001248EB65|nr:hypothetical protein [Actinomadura sp. WMMB 499]QFG23106.1 hypothetical protein F7P10_20245 [Actinomadura sp. WMMB 499]